MKKLLALLLVLTVLLGCTSAMAWNFDGLPGVQLCLPVTTDKIPIQVPPVTVPEIEWYIKDGFMWIESEWFYDDKLYSFMDGDLYNLETEESLRVRFYYNEETDNYVSLGYSDLEGFCPTDLECHTRTEDGVEQYVMLGKGDVSDQEWTMAYNLSSTVDTVIDGRYVRYKYSWSEDGYLERWYDESRNEQTNDTLSVAYDQAGNMTDYTYVYPTSDEMLWNEVTFLADGTLTDACFLIGDQRYSYSYSTTSGKEYWYKGYSWGPQIEAPEGYSREVLCDRFPALTHGAFDVVGDADGDGMVTVNDVMDILRFSAGDDMDISFYGSDVTNDGLINERDALLILQKMAGWDVQLK